MSSGTWQPVGRHTILVAGAAPTDEQRVLAACLDNGDGTYASHHTAAALWSLPGFEMLPPHVLGRRARRDHQTSLAIVHTSRCLPEHHTTVLDGIPLVTPTRLVFDLANFLPLGRLAVTIDRLWSRRLTSGPLLSDMLDELDRPGRRGIAAARSLLEQRGRDYIPPESGLESRFQQLLVEDGQPPMKRQVDLGDQVQWLARVDFLDDSPLIVEIDGDAYHRALVDEEADRIRVAALEAAGFTVLRLSAFDVWHRPVETMARVREARRRARSASVRGRAA